MGKKVVLFISISFCVWSLSFADVPSSVVNGIVTGTNGNPIEFVLVSAGTFQQPAITNEKGEYAIALSPGEHRLRFYHLNFVEWEQTVRLTENKETTCHVVMKENAAALSEIVVYGKSVKRELETKGFAVDIIEPQKAAMQSVQTNELLDRTAGVRVRQNGGVGAATNYNLNGMTGNSVKVFVDGIPISTYGPSFSLNSIPPLLIERIEVYKGVVPPYLSDDALGGAINIVLKNGMRNSLNASLSYGSFNTQQATFQTLVRDAKTGFTVKASGFYHYSDNDYEVWGKFVKNILPNGREDFVRAKRFNDAYRSFGGLLELGFSGVKWADRFYIGYNGSDDYNEIQHGAYMSIPYKGRFTESRSNVFSLNYKKRDLAVKGLEFTLNGMHSLRKEVVTDTVPWNYNWFGEISLGMNGEPVLRPNGAQQGAPTLNHIDRNVTTFRAGLNYDIISGHKLTLNHVFYTIDRRQQDFMRSETERDFVGERDLRKNISSLAYEIQAFDRKLTASLFGKYYQQAIEKREPVLNVENGQRIRIEEAFSDKKEETGYGLAASYNAFRWLWLLASAEKAVRMPSEGEVFGSPGENTVENTGLRAEVSNNLNVGLKATLPPLGKQRFDVSASAFIRNTRDKIARRINPRLNDAIQTDPFENLGKTKSKGFEAELRYAYGNNLSAMLNVSRFHSVFDLQYDSNGHTYRYYNKQLPNEPFFTANGAVQYTLHSLVQRDNIVNWYYNCGFVESFNTTWMDVDFFKVPRQFIHHLGVNYTFPGKAFIASFDAKNVFDQQVYDNFAVQKPGRAFYFKINYKINKY